MESREQEVGRIKYLIEKLRSITLTVQVSPFAYTLLYIIILFLYPRCKESVLNTLDTLFYVSPLMVAMFLIESKVLKLCKWHKTACVIPIIPQVFVFVDRHIIRLTAIEVRMHYWLLFSMSILLLIAAYNVFLKPKHNEFQKFTNRDS